MSCDTDFCRTWDGVGKYHYRRVIFLNIGMEMIGHICVIVDWGHHRGGNGNYSIVAKTAEGIWSYIGLMGEHYLILGRDSKRRKNE